MQAVEYKEMNKTSVSVFQIPEYLGRQRVRYLKTYCNIQHGQNVIF